MLKEDARYKQDELCGFAIESARPHNCPQETPHRAVPVKSTRDAKAAAGHGCNSAYTAVRLAECWQRSSYLPYA